MMKDIRLSFLVHCLLLLVLVVIPLSRGGEKEGDKKRGADYTEVEILEPESPEQETEVVVEDGVSIEEMEKRVPHIRDKCPKFYGGIGITHGLGEISEVKPGYPAHRAGIKPGDEIISNINIRGKVGTSVEVVIRRGMQTIRFNLVRDKICTT